MHNEKLNAMKWIALNFNQVITSRQDKFYNAKIEQFQSWNKCSSKQAYLLNGKTLSTQPKVSIDSFNFFL